MNEETLRRRQAMLDYDEAMRNQFGTICGVDEAGRGPLAGDVYAAAVILPPGHTITGLDDSKKLSEKRRESLFDEIIKQASAYCIASASVDEIEQTDILKASMLAMQRAAAGLQVKPARALIDGNCLPSLPVPAACVVKGDATSASIAAASILAKVARDRYMCSQAALYPQYGFEKHKGYGTKAHYDALRQYGACPIHRQLFLRKFYEQNKQNADR